jgi:hypothetical protein
MSSAEMNKFKSNKNKNKNKIKIKIANYVFYILYNCVCNLIKHLFLSTLIKCLILLII